MKQEVGMELWEKLHPKVADLFATWKLYRALYANKRTTERMKEISGTGFAIIQQCMIHEQIRLAMALTDPPGQGRHRNLSIHGLVEYVPPSVADEMTKSLGEIEEPMNVLRQHRNKRLMHLDMPTATGDNVLPRLLTDHLEAVVKGIGRAMSEASLGLSGKGWIYEWIVIRNAQGAFQWMISDAVRYRMLIDAAHDPEVSDAQLRRMVCDRGGHDDETNS